MTDFVESSNLDKAVKSVAKLWEYMISNDSAGKRVPEQMLQSALRNVCTAIPWFTQNVMQDAQEMDTYIMGHISNLLLDNIEISQQNSVSPVINKLSEMKTKVIHFI